MDGIGSKRIQTVIETKLNSKPYFFINSSSLWFDFYNLYLKSIDLSLMVNLNKNKNKLLVSELF